MDLLTPERFEEPGVAYAYQRTIFDEVASGERPPTISITPSARHVGVTKRDTHRPGFMDAVRAADGLGYPVLVRGAGGGAIAAGPGTLGFSIIRPARPEDRWRGTDERYDEAAALVLGAFSRLGFDEAEVGEVRDEFCPGDHSLRVGGWRDGMKLVGIAQRITRRATSVGGIVLVHDEAELARALEGVYRAMGLPFRTGSVGSLRKAGSVAEVEDVVRALAEEAGARYDTNPIPLDPRTLETAKAGRDEFLMRPPA